MYLLLDTPWSNSVLVLDCLRFFLRLFSCFQWQRSGLYFISDEFIPWLASPQPSAEPWICARPLGIQRWVSRETPPLPSPSTMVRAAASMPALSELVNYREKLTNDRGLQCTDTGSAYGGTCPVPFLEIYSRSPPWTALQLRHSTPNFSAHLNLSGSGYPVQSILLSWMRFLCLSNKAKTILLRGW